MDQFINIPNMLTHTCLCFQVLEAQTIYADKEPNKKGFTFNHCWLKVRNCAKFTAVPSSKRSRTSNSNPIDVLGQEDNDSGKNQTPDSSLCSAKRPMGRKQAKGKVKKGGEEYKYAGMLERFLIEKEKIREARWQEKKKMQERKASIEERKVAIKERKLMWEQEQKIIFSDVNTLDSNVKAYVLAMRAIYVFLFKNIMLFMDLIISFTADGVYR